MSTIFGVVRFDGRPAAEETLLGMQAALTDTQPVEWRRWHSGPAAFGVLGAPSVPGGQQETVPVHVGPGGAAVVAAGRLDNREELFAALGPWDRSHRCVSDTALIARAYERWGEGCPSRLLGDWGFAAWHEATRRLFLARDQHGTTKIFYHRGSGLFAFAPSPKGLLALPDLPRRLDEDELAAALLHQPRDGRSTFYRDIHASPPAHAVTVDPNGMRQREYWRLADAPRVRLASDAEYVEAARALYEDAVRCRLRTHRTVGVTLSGGLDSGSVATLAARHLAAEGTRLAAFSSVPLHGGALPGHEALDETPRIEALRAAVDTIDVTYCRAEHVSPVTGARRMLDSLGSPLFNAVNAHWIVALLDAAQEGGVGVLLTGHGGNTTLSWPGDRDQAVRALVRDRWWGALRQELTAPFGRSVAHGARNLLRPFVPLGARSAAPSRAARLGMIGHQANPDWADTRGATGVEARDPTWDRRVLEFCLGLPEHQFVRLGRRRWLIRRMMAGQMPDEVLWSPYGSAQAFDVRQRIQASYDETWAVLQDVKGSALAQEYVDLDRVEAALGELRGEIGFSAAYTASALVLHGLTLGLFLAGF